MKAVLTLVVDDEEEEAPARVSEKSGVRAIPVPDAVEDLSDHALRVPDLPTPRHVVPPPLPARRGSPQTDDLDLDAILRSARHGDAADTGQAFYSRVAAIPPAPPEFLFRPRHRERAARALRARLAVIAAAIAAGGFVAFVLPGAGSTEARTNVSGIEARPMSRVALPAVFVEVETATLVRVAPAATPATTVGDLSPVPASEQAAAFADRETSRANKAPARRQAPTAPEDVANEVAAEPTPAREEAAAEVVVEPAPYPYSL